MIMWLNDTADYYTKLYGLRLGWITDRLNVSNFYVFQELFFMTVALVVNVIVLVFLNVLWVSGPVAAVRFNPVEGFAQAA